MCMNFRDLNKACHKENYPTPFIDQIIDECVESEIFSFMDGFFYYNEIHIHLEDQHKTVFIYTWGTFSYRKMSFGLKNFESTFYQAMSYTFHDIKHNFKSYVDDLAAQSHKWGNHPTHICRVFDRCQYYRIQLNPRKIILCVVSGILLGFIVSKHGIMVNPFKVEAIVHLPRSHNIHQL